MVIIIDYVQRWGRWLEYNEQGKPGGGGQSRGRGRSRLGGTRDQGGARPWGPGPGLR